MAVSWQNKMIQNIWSALAFDVFEEVLKELREDFQSRFKDVMK